MLGNYVLMEKSFPGSIDYQSMEFYASTSAADAGQRLQSFVQLLDPFLRLIPLHL